jgi:hypothetical protein
VKAPENAEDSMTMITPLHIATVGGQPLRFFKTPLNDGRADFPWHAVDDLQHCLGMDRNMRRVFLRKLKGDAEWGKYVRTIATPDGPVTIAPHALAKPALKALIDTGRVQAPASVRDEYTAAIAEASMKLNAGPLPSPEAVTAWANAMVSRWTPLDKPISVAELFPNKSGVTTSENEGETEYLLTEGQTLFLTICACGDKEMTSEKVKDICHDMVKVIMAWRHRKLLPLWEVPHLAALCKEFETPDWSPPTTPPQAG